MKLSHYNLKNISEENVILPQEDIFELPEKVLQFGTGMLLRGLPDYFIDKANRHGIFNGRVVVVKSTAKGDSAAFDRQDGLYTVCRRGVSKGEKVEENVISSAISRVLIAQDEWEDILHCARNPDMKIIISNTTEMGLQLVKNDDIKKQPPSSFPGKLLAFLYERYKAFEGSVDSGFIIIPTELVPDNGKVLESILTELALLNGLEDEFIEWIESANRFCSSLVDRIVTGMPSQQERDNIYHQLGYTDDLLTITEAYGLWAIEGDDKVKEELSFYKANEEVKIEPDIDIYRELKLRLLNATHTFSSGIAFFAGIDTVKDALNDEAMSSYIEALMLDEIGPSIPMEIKPEVKQQFIHDVLDRFRNPNLEHHWKTIAQNYSQKIKLRCMPLVARHYTNCDDVLPLISFGIAAWLTYTKVVKEDNGKFFGQLNGKDYLIDDEQASVYYPLWQLKPTEEVVQEILSNEDFWGYELLSFPGFYNAVLENLNLITESGMREAMEQTMKQKSI